jgi:glutamyl-tRNA synthetase
MFEALKAAFIPKFAHFSMVTVKDEKISKRIGGFEIEALREIDCLEPMAINSFFALIGSSIQVKPYKTAEELAKDFEITNLSKSPTSYIKEELERLNHKLLLGLEFNEVQSRLKELDIAYVTEEFWQVVRPNLEKLSDLKIWWQICFAPNLNKSEETDSNLLSQAVALLPEEITGDTWKEWTANISSATGKKGRDLFIPLRLAITGYDHGPELKHILPLLHRDEIIKRLRYTR